ncbi:MAG TPA: DUF488 family protein [Xanthobacteraceae bacterium]|nr:DUF488 family protein [Xanthobacteraceae bacterium]
MTSAKRAGAASRGLRVKRVYAPAEAGDGLRVLVDRLWPRGIAKAKARIDLWLKDIAPSDALRRRVHADPAAWDSFAADYARELKAEPGRSAVAQLRERRRDGPVTLLYASRDEARNNAVALKRLLEKTR